MRHNLVGRHPVLHVKHDCFANHIYIVYTSLIILIIKIARLHKKEKKN